MTIEAGLTEFAEYLGGEIRRVENKIPTVGGQSNSPASAQIIAGEGRPDKPETTGGKIAGNEPNGTFYNSTNGSGVGAYLWQKQNNKWVVISGDTGSRDMSRSSVNVKEGRISLRRVNNTVECSFSKGRWDTISFLGSSSSNFRRKNHAKRMDIPSLLCFLFIAMTVKPLQRYILVAELIAIILSYGLRIAYQRQTSTI